MSDLETEVQAAVFRRFVKHLQDRPQVQNIELMILAEFCRNCLSKWYNAAAEERGLELKDEEARELIYGMSYDEWKEKFQLPATDEQLAAMKIVKAKMNDH